MTHAIGYLLVVAFIAVLVVWVRRVDRKTDEAAKRYFDAAQDFHSALVNQLEEMKREIHVIKYPCD